jgi:hypothetical protein
MLSSIVMGKVKSEVDKWLVYCPECGGHCAESGEWAKAAQAKVLMKMSGRPDKPERKKSMMRDYFGYDPELPAGYQDADLEMREFEGRAAEQRVRSKKMRKLSPATARRVSRAIKDDAYSALGMIKVKGARGGIYYE